MGASVAATTFGLAALLMAFVLTPALVNPALLVRALLIWALALVCIMFIRDPLIALALVGALVAFLSPGARERAPLFLLIAACVPVNLTTLLPFPGLNYLIVLTHYKLAVLVLLVPVLVMAVPPRRSARSTALPDMAIVGYALFGVFMTYVTYIDTGVSSITGALRTLVDMLLLLIIPYFAISKFVQSEKDLELCFRALLTASIILASIAFIATVRGWDFYRHVEEASVFTMRDYRYGFERINATANTHSLGYICGFGIVLLIHLRRSANISSIKCAILVALLGTGMFVTISRGAMLGSAVAALSYFVFTRKGAQQRLAMLMVLVGLGAGAAVFILQGQTDAVDPFGAVEYRRLLLETSIQYISEHLWFGNQNFALDPRFLPLLQGQGIIDITNFYLQVLLNYGLIGFLLFFGSIGVLLVRHIKLLLSSKTMMTGEAGQGNRQRAVLVAGMLGWLALMTTTSDVGLTMFTFVTLVALARASWSLAPSTARVGQPSKAKSRLHVPSAAHGVTAAARARIKPAI